MNNFLAGLGLSLFVGLMAGIFLPYPYYLIVASFGGFYFALKVHGWV